MKFERIRMKINPSRQWLSFVALMVSVVLAVAQANDKTAVASTDSIVGVVVDAVTNQPLAGAQIQTSDQRVTAMSDENGRFVLRLTAPVRTMYFNAPGYDRKDIPVYKTIRKVTVKLSLQKII